jgi:hypothetical protein
MNEKMHRRSRFDSVFWGRVLGVALVFLASFTVIQNFRLAEKQHELTICQQEFVTKFTNALKERTDAANVDRAAIDNLVYAITAATKDNDPNGFQKALAEYAATRKATDDQRAENPYPDTTLSEECNND